MCNGPITVSNARVSYDNVRAYGCSYHRTRGDTVCANTLRRPLESVNQAVTEWISENMLSEEVILETLREVRRRLVERTKATTTDLPRIEQEAAQLRTEISRLITALAATDHKPEPVIAAVAERQERLSALEARIRGAKAAPEAIQMELKRMEAEAKRRIHELREMLARNPEEARRVVETVFSGPLRFTPVEQDGAKRYRIQGEASIPRMLTGAPSCTNSASPAGHCPCCPWWWWGRAHSQRPPLRPSGQTIRTRVPSS